MGEEITEQQAQEILRNFAESKSNVHTFFTNVVKTKDTTKTGNLSEEELGLSNLPFRTYKELALFSSNIAGQDAWANYFNEMGEVQSASSLSKGGFLMRLSVTNTQQLADVTKSKKKNKGWFKKKPSEEETG